MLMKYSSLVLVCSLATTPAFAGDPREAAAAAKEQSSSGSSGSTIKDAATKSAISGGVAVIADNLLQKQMTELCGAKMAWACVIAAGAAAQVLKDGVGVLFSSKTKGQASPGGSTAINPNYPGTTDGETKVIVMDPNTGLQKVIDTSNPLGLTKNDIDKLNLGPEIKTAMKDAVSTLDSLKDKGLTIDSNGQVAKDGKAVTSSALSNPGAFADAFGLSAKERDLLNSAIAKSLEEGKKATFSVVPMGYGGGGGGGMASSRGSGSSGIDADPQDSLARAMAAAAAKGRDPAAVARAQGVAGMTRTLGSDRIGVMNDDIFIMISRRYIQKRMHHEFLTSPSGL